MSEKIIQVDHITKEYRLGAIGGGTLRGDLQSYMARLRKKEDPNSVIGSKQYYGNKKFLALNDVSFSINQGDRVGIVGHNGAGKSTLLKLLSRVTGPTSGTIAFNGRIASMLEVGTGFHPELTGRENVYMNGAILGMTKNEITRKFDEIVSFAEMEKFIDTPVKRYSSGMYVKLAFAVAAHLDSEILIMDEVLAVGDMKFQQKCLGKMDAVSRNEGKTILYVSHNMNTVKQLCDRCILLDHGQVAYDGEVDEGISRYLGVGGANTMVFSLADQFRDTSNSYFHQRAKMLQLKIINAENTCFSSEDSLDMLLEWEALENCTDVFIRMLIRYTDSTPLGFATTIEPISVEKGKTVTSHLKLSLKNLASGRYYAAITMYKTAQAGGHDIVDSIENGIRFQVENNSIDSNKLPTAMQHRTWGHAVLPHMQLIKGV